MILSQRRPSNTPIEKSPEAYRTIREVADSLDLPQHVLRFWETRFPQIRPLKRAGGRRYYRPDDIERLRLIKRLLYEQGYTIKGVQKLFKEQGVQALSAAPPSAAAISIDGRVTTANGQGIGKVAVTIESPQTGVTLRAITNQFGFYSFTDLPVGSYFISVSAKGRRFSPPNRLVNVFSDLSGEDFIEAAQ